MVEGTDFPRIYPERGEAADNANNVKRVVFCTGKIYYELVKERAARGLVKDVAIVRVEQLSPFPFDLVLEELRKYPNADLLWSQEEHKNQGWWSYIHPNIDCVSRHMGVDKKLQYVELSLVFNATFTELHLMQTFLLPLDMLEDLFLLRLLPVANTFTKRNTKSI